MKLIWELLGGLIIRPFIRRELNDNCKSFSNIYGLKLERNIFDKLSTDGKYYEFETLNDLKNAIQTYKEEYKNIRVIDKENILGRNE